MLHVLAQYDVEVAWSGDQEVVEAFPSQCPMNRSTIAFARGARIGVRMIRRSAAVKTASNAAVNLLSRTGLPQFVGRFGLDR